jgi:hypothetical protein
MAKDKIMSFRISYERYKKIQGILKLLGQPWSWALDYGLDNVEQESQEFLQKEAEKYHKMYIQCITKINEKQQNVIQCITEIDDLKQLYIDTGRSVEQPSHEDLFWVKQRLKKFDGWNADMFIKHCNGEVITIDGGIKK